MGQHFVISTLSLFFTLQIQAGTLGRYDGVRNLPGFITNDKTSPIYQGVSVLASRAKNKVERRTPSALLHETYIDPKTHRILESAIFADLQHSRRDENAAFAVYCEKNKPFMGDAYCNDSLDVFRSKRDQRTQDFLKDFDADELSVARVFAEKELRRALELSKSLPPLKTLEALNSPQAQQFYESLFNGLEILSSLRNNDNTFAHLSGVYEAVDNALNYIVIKSQVEASNLLLTGTADLSARDPQNSGLWRAPQVPIHKYDTLRYSGMAQPQLPEELLNSKASVDIEYKGAKNSGTTPKIDVLFQGRTYKLKFQTKIPHPSKAGKALQALDYYRQSGNEIQSENVVNQLAAAIGFSVDPTFYKQKVRLFVKDGFNANEISTEEGRKVYAARFNIARNAIINELIQKGPKRSGGLSSWDYGSAFSNIMEIQDGPEKGRKYVEMNEVSLEARKDMRHDFDIGGFSKENLGHHLRREFRGLMVFYAWINDVDAKYANAELKLIPKEDGSGGYHLAHVASDMGASLGDITIKNRPNLFPSELVVPNRTSTVPQFRVNVPHLTLNLTHYSKSKLWEAVTINDVRWAARLISQLTYDQIYPLFLHLDYPAPIAEFYTQLLLRRRDQLVQSTGLLGTTVKAYGTGESRTIQLESKMTEPAKFTVSGYEDCFDKGKYIAKEGKCDAKWAQTGSIHSPEAGTTEEALHNALYYAGIPKLAEPFIKKLQRIELPTNLLLSGFPAGQDSFIPARYIIENPFNKGKLLNDKPYWIIDVFRTGFDARVTPDVITRLSGEGFNADEIVEVEPKSLQLKWKFKSSKTWEFIRVRAVAGPEEFIKGLEEVYLDPKNYYRSIKDLSEKMAANMQPGDVFISSSYIGAGATGGANYLPTGIPLLNLSLKAGLNTLTFHRLTLIREEAQNYLANWSDVTKEDLGGSAAIRASILSLLSAKARLTDLSGTDQLYRFNVSIPEQREMLMKNLKRAAPQDKKEEALSKELLPLAVNEVAYTNNSKSYQFSVLGIPSFLSFSNVQTMAFVDPETKAVRERFLSIKKTNGRSGFSFFTRKYTKGHQTTSEAIADSNGQIHARFIVDYNTLWATSSDFFKLKEKHFSFMPTMLTKFKNEDTNYDMGSLEFDSEIFLSNAALSEILGKNLSKKDVCDSIAKRVTTPSSEKLMPHICNEVFSGADIWERPIELARNDIPAQIELRRILAIAHEYTNAFVEAQEDYVARASTTLTDSGAKSVKKALKSIVKLLGLRPLRSDLLRRDVLKIG
ncbi:MAG: hypothetical protein AB7F59_04580, partial [Bdellovibrionales bacterium]